MKLEQYRKKAIWLMPGLSVKRWVMIALGGLVCIAFGLAWALNLQPVTKILNLALPVLQHMALLVPSNASGPVVLVVGIALFYYGMKKTYGTLYSAMNVGSGSLLEALYRKRKLANGPHIVAIGGGTGLSTLLRGLKHYTSNITAVVTVGDDGGSSGRLRKEQGIIPPGDIRNCIAALADEEKLITELFQYRFQNGQGLEGHSFGNLFLTAMCRVTGDMVSAIKESSNVLNIRGRVLPSTLDNVMLCAEFEDGTVAQGESEIPHTRDHGRIRRLFSIPENPTPMDDVLKAIAHAELIILGPGSLYTSVIPNLLIPEIARAIANSPAPKAYVANIVTQPGETDGFSAADHVRAILDHAGCNNLLNAVFLNNWLPDSLIDKYEKAGCAPVVRDADQLDALGVVVVEKLLLDENEFSTLRHNPRRLARAIIAWFKQVRQTTPRRERLRVRPSVAPTDPALGTVNLIQSK